MTTTALAAFALCVCGSLRAAGQGTAAPRKVERVALPGADWALDLSLDGFNRISDTLHNEGRGPLRMLIATHAGPKKLMLLIRMSPAPDGGDGRAFRERTVESAKKNGIRTSSWKVFEYAGLPLLKYSARLPSPNPVPVVLPGGPVLSDPTLMPGTQNLSAFLGRDGVWVALTLMGESIGEKDEKVFYAVLDTVKLADTSSPANSFDFFHKGHPLYAAREYRKAAEFYARALELERRERRLDAATWRALVEESAVAWASVDDLDSAGRTVEHGLSQEPDNAVFHYLMAGVHAARDDLDATIASLQKAFQHKAALPAGQRLPDPRKHPPFQRFAKDEKFRQATKNMKP